MSKKPFVWVYVVETKQDISFAVESLDYTMDVEKDDKVDIAIKSEYASYIFDDKNIREGNTIYFRYGNYGEDYSVKRVGIITSIETSYAERTTWKFTASDAGAVLKGQNDPNFIGYMLPDAVWYDAKSTNRGTSKSLASIALQIADKTGLALNLHPDLVSQGSPMRYTSNPSGIDAPYMFPYGNDNFFSIMTSIAHEMGCIFYVRGKEMYITKRADATGSGLSKRAKLFFEYGIGKDVISFSAKSKPAETSQATANTNTQTNDNKQDKTFTVAVPVKGDKKPVNRMYDPNGIEVTAPEAPPDLTEVGFAANRNTAVSKNGAMKISRLAAKVTPEQVAEEDRKDAGKGREATLKILGLPSAEADTVIQMAGVAPRDMGLWYVKKVKHSVHGSSYYYTEFSLDKADASKKVNPADEKTTTDAKKFTMGINVDGTVPIVNRMYEYGKKEPIQKVNLSILHNQKI